MQPAWDKVAAHFRIDPVRTILTIQAHAEALEPMSETEIALRVMMLRGLADSSTTHPTSTRAH